MNITTITSHGCLKKAIVHKLKHFCTLGAMLVAGAAVGDTWTDADDHVWSFTVDATHATVTGVDPMRGVLTMPETLGGQPVTAFGTTFKGQEDVTRVTLPAGITSIDSQAFLNCKNLKVVTIKGEAIKSIGYQAFMGCYNMNSFVIPNSVKTLGQGVFSGCSALEEITIGDGIETLTGVVWGGSSVLSSSSEYGDNMRGSIGNGLFYNCTSLKTINWGKNVKTIGNIAFLACSALEKVDIPDTVTSIGNHAFYQCGNLSEVKIGNKVTSIGRMAFCGDGNLTKVTFGNSVTEIQQQAFQDCVNLQNFTLPTSIQYLRYRCFAGCSKALTEVIIPTNKDELETELGQGVFSNCANLDTVAIGDTVKTLTGVEWGGSSVLSSSSEYGDNMRGSIGNGLFYNCTSLKTINWGKNVKTIGNVAFLACSALEKVDIPDTVTSIGNHAFYQCGNLGEVKIGNKVTSIGRMAFCGDGNLTKVTFGNSVTEIQQQAFQDCVNLPNFTLPTSIQYLRYRCFAGCSKALTEVIIPTNKDELETELGQGVFSNCAKLETVTIGDTVKTLTGVEWGGSSVLSSSSEYGDNMRGSIGNGLFYNCTSLKTINWGKGVKTIGNIAFLNCTALEHVSLPTNVSAIGCHAFYNCSALKTVDVAGAITSIGRRAFANCPNLLYVNFMGDSMAFDAGTEIFAFDNEEVKAYAANGSTGWTGVADVAGLPADGMWRGAKISYGNVAPYAPEVTLDPEKEPEVTPEPEKEPEVTPEPEKEPEVTPEPEKEPEVTPEPETEEGNTLFKEVTGELMAGHTYDGFLANVDGMVAGTITVKAAKASKDTSKLTISIVEQGKKLAYTGNYNYTTHAITVSVNKKDARKPELTFGNDAMGGTFGDYVIQGARNVFASALATDKAAAATLMKALPSVWTLVYEDNDGFSAFTVTLASKGKVKLAGALANGTKVSVTSQLIVGNGRCCIPVSYVKAKVALGFALWLTSDGLETAVDGLGDAEAIFGAADALSEDVAFGLDIVDLANLLGDGSFAECYPDGLAVSQIGAKWVVMPDDDGKAASVGKIVLDRDGTINEAKSRIDGYNVSGLKLTYTVKTGAFKGSFKAYYLSGAKLKSATFTVSGVLVDGVGYGMATARGLGSLPLTIK